MRIAYYECGGAYDLDTGENAPKQCPHDDCDAVLDRVEDFGD